MLLWFCIQLFKVVCDLVTTKKFNFKRIILKKFRKYNQNVIINKSKILE